jgi:hypothetical protein
MASNLCSRGIYGCRHDEGHIPTNETVLQYFKDHDGYVLSRNLYDYFGCCTTEQTSELSVVLSYLQHATKDIQPVSASAWGLVGVEHPKIQKQQRLISKEMTTGKIHLVQDGVMIHDRDGALLFDYATTEDPDEVTCGLCLNILKVRNKKSN